MEVIDVILIAGLILTVCEACIIIGLNIKKGDIDRTRKLHMICLVVYPIYLSSVLYASLEQRTSQSHCDTSWKVCCTLYIAVAVAVYMFYYVKSVVMHTIRWKGKKTYERIALSLIFIMILMGLIFFWLPIPKVQWEASLSDGECVLAPRKDIPIIWMLGDTVLSILLLMLFVKPLEKLRRQSLGGTQMFDMKSLIHKNRNLLAFVVFVTLVVMVTIAAVELKMVTIHYLCAADRFVTLQCITMTFNIDAEVFCYYPRLLFSLCKSAGKIDQKVPSTELSVASSGKSNSATVIVMSRNSPE